MGKDRDWLDYVGTLLLPVVVAVGGILYTAHNDGLNRTREAIEHSEEESRQALARDSGYVELLASTNDRERDLGIKIIDALSKEHKFSTDLIPVVAAVAGGRPSDPTTQTAARILNANVTVAARAQLAAPATTPVQVYIQIAREDQRSEAQSLQAALKAAGFGAPGVELVPSGTVNTYVRYFAPNTASVANRVATLMQQQGLAASVQDFTNATAPLRQIEVWIGSKQT